MNSIQILEVRAATAGAVPRLLRGYAFAPALRTRPQPPRVTPAAPVEPVPVLLQQPVPEESGGSQLGRFEKRAASVRCRIGQVSCEQDISNMICCIQNTRVEGLREEAGSILACLRSGDGISAFFDFVSLFLKVRCREVYY